MYKPTAKAAVALASGLLFLGSTLPASAGQDQTLTKLGEEADKRRLEGAAEKRMPAARLVVKPQQAALLGKMREAAGRRARALAGQNKIAPLEGQSAWLDKLQRLQGQRLDPPKEAPKPFSPKASAAQQADEDGVGAPVLELGGGSRAGTLSPAGDTDAYRLVGSAGEVVDLSLESEDFDAYLELEFAGKVVAADDDGGEGANSLIDDFTLPASGTYTVRVRSYSDAGSGAYELAAAAGGAAVVEQGALVPGQDTYRLDPAWSSHLFLLQIDTYSQVQLNLSSGDFDTFLSLYAGSGLEDRNGDNLLAVDDDGGGGTNSLLSKPLEAGSYLVEVRAFSAGDTGAYRLSMETTTLGADEDSAGPVTLDLDQSLEGGLFPQGDTDTYTFSAQGGEVVDLSLESVDFDAFLELAVEGETIAVDDDGGEGFNALIDGFVLPASGEYQVVVHAYDDAGEGAYQVGISRQEAPWTAQGVLAGSRTGVLEAGESHLYTFNLSRLSRVELNLESAAFDAYFTLYDGQGPADLGPENQVGADDDGGESLNARLTLALEAGDYLVEARSFSPESAGAYELSLELEALAGDEDLAGGAALDLGDSLQGALQPAGDTDAYSLQGAAGQVVSLSLESEDFDAFLELEYSGEVIALDDDGGTGYNSLISGFVLPFSGSYRVLVHALGDDEAGEYQLSALDATPPVAVNATIVAGTKAGEISESGQLQLYPFVLAAAAEVEIELRSGDFDAYLTLYQGAGPADRSPDNLLAEDDDSGAGVDARLALPLPAGSYLIEARPLISGATGAYTLELGSSPLADDEDLEGPAEIQAGKINEGRLSPAGDLDTYRFTGSAGQQLSIGVVSGDFDPYVELLYQGEVLAADDDGGEDLNPLIDGFVLPVAGEYLVRVRSYADQGSGAYTVAAESAGGQLGLNVAIAPGAHSGQIASVGQSQLYPFGLGSRALVQFSLSAARFPAGLTLYQGSGLADRRAGNLVGAARALAAGETAQFTQELPAGDYLLEVASPSGQTGTFAFSLKSVAVQEARDRVSLVAGELNQTRLTPFAASLSVAPGAKISGQLDLAVDNTHPRSEVFQLVEVQTWGERQTGFRQLEDRVLPGNTRHSVAVDLEAPEEPGTYHLILAGAAEPGAEEIASGTHWESAPAPRWGDGDDLAAWSAQHLALARSQGWVEVEWYQNYRTQIGAFAVEVVVEAPEVVSTGPIALDFDPAPGDQGRRNIEGASPGQILQVQLHVAGSPRINGWGVLLQYDPDHLGYVGGSFASGAFIPGLVPLVAQAAGQVEVGGAVLGSGAANQGEGHLGTLSFRVQPGFSVSTILRATQVSFRTLDQGRIKEQLQAQGAIRGAGQTQTGPMNLDFDLTSGDQQERQREGVRAGEVVQVQLNVKEAPLMRGWSARIEYDPSQVRFVANSFAPSLFIPGLVSLVGEKTGRVDLGGTLLGSGAGRGGEGTLGTFSFEILPGFSSAELVITRISFNTVASGEAAQETHAVATLSGRATLQADFDGSGGVDFGDFFLFADHFGQSEGGQGWDPQYDLSGNGEVDFSDFFLFADNFGREAQGKLLALARQLLGLPEGVSLEQNHPNPFNGSTQIRYQLDQPTRVQLEIYNLQGQRVRTLVDQVGEAGFNQISWDGADDLGREAASGMYFCRLRAGEKVEVRRMLLLR